MRLVTGGTGSGGRTRLPGTGGQLGSLSHLAVRGGGNQIEAVIQETWSRTGSFLSRYTLTAHEALLVGERFLGPGYTEIGKPGSGVFRSADKTRQFRIDSSSLEGKHPPNIPHVHLETYVPRAIKPVTNNHIPFVD